MSKKDKKDHKKHSPNGSKKGEEIEARPIPVLQHVPLMIPLEEQLPINKKTYEK
jgi:hypothetical protein